MGKADLHLHTTASDGASTPADLVRLAGERHLNTISITDHDTIKGYLDAAGIANEVGVKLLPGVEVTTLHEKNEIHLLAYCFDEDHSELNNTLAGQRQARVNRMQQILDQLKKRSGFEFSLDEVISEAKSRNVGRPHLAQLMVKKKIVASFTEAFIRYLGRSVLDEIVPEFVQLEEMIRIVKRAGGAAILAHPGRLYDNKEIEAYIELGLDGLECIHPAHNFERQKELTKLAENRQLLITGGSDYHGTGKEYDPYFGILTLSEKHVNRLERLSQNRKRLKSEMKQ